MTVERRPRFCKVKCASEHLGIVPPHHMRRYRRETAFGISVSSVKRDRSAAKGRHRRQARENSDGMSRSSEVKAGQPASASRGNLSGFANSSTTCSLRQNVIFAMSEGRINPAPFIVGRLPYYPGVCRIAVAQGKVKFSLQCRCARKAASSCVCLPAANNRMLCGAFPTLPCSCCPGAVNGQTFPSSPGATSL